MSKEAIVDDVAKTEEESKTILNRYTQQLRTDSISLLFPLVSAMSTILSLLSIILYSSWDLGPIVPIITIVGSPLAASIAWKFAEQRDRQEDGGLIFIGTHIFLLTLNYAQLWRADTITPYALPYFYGLFIVLSSVIIQPRASFYSFAVSTLCMFGVIGFGGERTVPNFMYVTFASLINLFLAAATFLSILNWETAVRATSELHLKARRRRDELFDTQQELERANARLKFLNQQLETNGVISRRLTSILDLDSLLRQVTEIIGNQLKYGYVGIFLPNDNNQFTHAYIEAGLAINPHNPPNLKASTNGTVSQAAKTRKPIQVDHADQLGGSNQLNLLPGMQSELNIPFISKGTVLGVLNIQSRRIAVFNSSHLLVLEALADQVAIAIQNAILFQKEETRRTLSDTLREIGQALSGTLQLERVLDLILEHLDELVAYDRASVLLYRDKFLEIVAARGFPEGSDPLKIRISIEDKTDEDDVFVKIYNTRQPLNLPDISNHGDGWQQVENLPQTRSWLGIPFLRDGEVTGMLSLVREELKPYTDDEVELANTFASQATVALANARLYGRIERFNQQLEYEVQQRTLALQEAFEKLEQLDKAKSDFIEVSSHELRTPLTLIKGYSGMLLDDPTISDNNYHYQLVNGIHSGSIRLHEIVNYMLDMVKIDNQTLELFPEPVMLRLVIKLVGERFDEALKERHLTLRYENLESLPAVEADPESLKKVFNHLLVNAIKYTPDGGEIVVSGQPYTANSSNRYQRDGVEIIVKDTGIGIDAEFHHLIFTKFYQTGKVALHSTGKTKFKGGGPGLGLAIAKGVVDAHQGVIWVESKGHDETNYPGSQFHLILPLKQSAT